MCVSSKPVFRSSGASKLFGYWFYEHLVPTGPKTAARIAHNKRDRHYTVGNDSYKNNVASDLNLPFFAPNVYIPSP
jgi:hypothetical protein